MLTWVFYYNFLQSLVLKRWQSDVDHEASSDDERRCSCVGSEKHLRKKNRHRRGDAGRSRPSKLNTFESQIEIICVISWTDLHHKLECHFIFLTSVTQLFSVFKWRLFENVNFLWTPEIPFKTFLNLLTSMNFENNHFLLWTQFS